MLDLNEFGEVKLSDSLSTKLSTTIMKREEREVHLIKAMPPEMRRSFGCVPVYFNFYGRIGGANMTEWLFGFPEIDHPDWLPILRRFLLHWQRNIDAVLDAVEMSVVGRRKDIRPALFRVSEEGRLSLFN